MKNVRVACLRRPQQEITLNIGAASWFSYATPLPVVSYDNYSCICSNFPAASPILYCLPPSSPSQLLRSLSQLSRVHHQIHPLLPLPLPNILSSHIFPSPPPIFLHPNKRFPLSGDPANSLVISAPGHHSTNQPTPSLLIYPSTLLPPLP